MEMTFFELILFVAQVAGAAIVVLLCLCAVILAILGAINIISKLVD